MKTDRQIEKILASGMIEEYCLGTLGKDEAAELEQIARIHPGIEREIEETRTALSGFFKSMDSDRSDRVKHNIFQSVFKDAEEARNQYSRNSLINAHSDFSMWVSNVQGISRPEDSGSIFLHPIRSDEKIKQFVAWVQSGVENEIHTDMVESFLVLEGSCQCFLNNRQYDLKEGDFLEIPLFTNHNLKVTSECALKAILQRILL